MVDADNSCLVGKMGQLRAIDFPRITRWRNHCHGLIATAN
jgi:hypothetical protein